MAAKAFAVNDVLPATTQLRISWDKETLENDYLWLSSTLNIKSENNEFYIQHYYDESFHWLCVFGYNPSFGYDLYGPNYDTFTEEWKEPYTEQNYIVIDTSNWSESKRTISLVQMNAFTWEELYTITFNSNGGSSVSDITEATKLPTSLPTPTKSGYTFVAWYY